MSLVDVIVYGESKTIEFSEGMPTELEIAKVTVAFSNRAGGLFIIGVSDNDTVVGIDQDIVESISDSASRIIHDMITPMILPEIYTNRIKDKTVVVIKIFPGAATPYYIKSLGKLKGTFIRVGKTNVQADTERINELERQRFNISFDEDTSCEAGIADIEELCKLLSFHMKRQIDKEQLRNLKILKNYGEIEYFTNAAVIILGKMPNSGIRYAKFKDDLGNVFIYKKDFYGNIFEQLENAVSFVGDLGIPIIAIKEVIVNALIHRDYAIIGSEIKIAVYETKIEIISPGDLPKTITIEDILSGSGRSETRNKVVAKIIKECGLMDQWGSGINRMLSLCNDEGLKAPIINEDGIFFRVTFFRYAKKEPERIGVPQIDSLSKSVLIGKSGNAVGTENVDRSSKIISSVTAAQLDTVNQSRTLAKSGTASQTVTVAQSGTKTKLKKKDLTKNENELIENIIKNNPNVTIKNISEKLVISIASVKRRINKLQNEKVIERIGPNKGGYWKVMSNTKN